jgi:phage gp29-like protein
MKASDSEVQKLLSVIATNPIFGHQFLSAFLPNPDIVLQKLGKGVEVYEQLTYDPHIRSCMQSRNAGTLGLLWAINRGGVSTAQSIFIETIFKDLKLRKIIKEMLDATAYGFKPLEVLWKRFNNQIIPSTVLGKPPSWFVFDSNNLLQYKDMTSLKPVLPPSHKFILIQCGDSFDNPYGKGYLPTCWWPWTFKKGGMKFWVKFIEKYGIPWAYGKYPRGSQQDEIDSLFNDLDGMIQDGVIVTPDDCEVGTLNTIGTGTSDLFQRLEHFCNTEISKAILSQTLTTEQGDTGSYAMSETHLQVRQEIVDSDKRMVEDAFNLLIHWMIDYNFDSVIDYPTFELYQEKDISKDKAIRDVALWGSGWVKPTQEYIDENYCDKTGDMIVLESPIAPAQATPAVGATTPFTESLTMQPSVDSLKTKATNDLTLAYQKMLEPVRVMIDKATTYEDIEKGLLEMYPNLDDSELQQIVTQATLISRVGGQVEVKENN